ncbi:MAG: phosphocarrier protein HPr [Spirochaetaceae bacterium 4572_59]|nr:MAG: phosphocarrier protein HPr [Spirochaetaceae bacterium 4572_59]
MIRKDTKVQNRAGLHARPAALIVQAAGQYESSIFIEKDSEKINAKSIMGLLTMGAAYGSELVITADGPDEEDAVNALIELFENRFSILKGR